MAQDVQGMLVRIEATTAQLRAEMAKADRAVESATKGIDSDLAKVDKAFDRVEESAKTSSSVVSAALRGVGAAATAAVAGMVALTAQSATAAREIKSMALLANTSTTEFQRYAAGSRTVGVEQGKLADILKDVNDRVGDFLTTGGGEMADFFEKIAPRVGVAAEQFRKLSGPQSLQLFYNSLEKANLSQAEMTFYMESMADEATSLIPLLKNGGAGFKELGDQAARSGRIISELDIEKLVEVDQAIQKLKDSFRGATTELATGLLPVIGEVTGSLDEIATSGALQTLGDGVSFLVERFDVLVALLGGAAAAAMVKYTAGMAAAGIETTKRAAATVKAAQADMVAANNARAAAASAELVAAAELNQLKHVQAALAAEKALEAQRLKAQITDKGRQQTIARMVELRTAEVAIAKQLTAAETQLAAATKASQAAASGWAVAGRGLLGLLGGPAGIASLAIGAATSFLLFRDNADEAKSSSDKLASSVDSLSTAADRAAQRYSKLLANVDKLNKVELGARTDELESQLRTAEAQLKGFERQFERGVGTQGMVEGAKAAITVLKDELARLREVQGSAGEQVNEEYDKYLARLKESAALQGENSEAAKVRYAIESGELGKLTEPQQALLLQYAKEKDAKVAAAKAGDEYSRTLKDQLKAVDDLIAKYDPATKAQADYEAAIKLADEALLNGTYTTEQYQKVVQGLWTDLNKPIWDKHNEASDKAKEAIKKIDDQLQSVRDRLDPAGKAARDFADEQDFLREAVDKGNLSLEEYNKLLPLLRKEYEQNTRATSDWAQWTEGALDRVDSAFADAWRNIGDGFSSFRDSLTNAFKQMLAELAHMAITKPILLQLGASMGIGGGTQGNNGIGGSLLGGGSGTGGSSGIGGALQVANQGRSLLSGYGTIQSMWPALQGGWGSGGFGGMLSAGGSALGSMFGFGSGAAGSMAAGSTAAGYTGAGMQAWVAAQAANTAATTGLSAALSSAASSMASMWYLAPIIGAWQSGKLYDQGVRPDASETWSQGGHTALGKISNVAPTLQSKFFEVLDSGLQKASFGLVDGKIAAMLSGSTFHQALWGGISKKLFGGAWETKDGGIALGATDGDLSAQQYIYQKKKGGLFSSSKKRTRYSALDDETLAALQETYDATEAGVASLFESLSLSVEEGSLAGLQLAREKISTKGKTEEEISQAISEWFGTAAEAMNAELNRVFATGLDYDLTGMQAFVGNLQGVNEVIRYLDVSMYDMSVAGGKLAESLSAAAGGLDALAINSQTYYGAFFTDAEKVEDTIDSITRTFEQADVTLAGSRAEYRAMVEDIDLTTEAGQEMFATMMALSGQAAQYYSIVEQQAAQANAALLGTVNSAYAALQRSIAAEQREIQQAASSTAANINALTGVSNSLDAALKKLRGTSDDTVRMLRAQATMTLNSALVTARSGGSLAGFSGLQDALDVASEMDTALYGSLEQFEREQGRTANLIAELEKVNGKQLTVEQQVLKSLESQLSALDQQLLFAQAQLDALNGVDSSVLSIVDAVNAMNASVVAALSLMGGDTGKNATPQNVGTLADSVYRSVLGREADAGGLAYWQGQVASGAIRLDQLEQAIKNAAKENGEIPAFASGGFHAGGMRLVGENGPELEVTGPSRIYNASQTAAMLGGGDSARALASLQQSVERQGEALRSIAKHTMQTAKRVEFLERWDYDGLPTERDVA